MLHGLGQSRLVLTALYLSMYKLKEWAYVLKQQQMHDQDERQGIPCTLE